MLQKKASAIYKHTKHEAIANKLQSDDQLEWSIDDIDVECSETEEVDDMIPVLDIVDEF